MFTTVRSRLILIISLMALCAWALLPKEGPTGERLRALNLGLDLQGGMHLEVEIADPDGTLTGDQKADAIERTLTTIRNRIDEFGVREPTIQRVGNERILVELAGIDDPERAKAIVERTAYLEFKMLTDGTALVAALPRMDRAIVNELGSEGLESFEPEPEPELGIGDVLNPAGAADSAQAEETDAEAPAAEGGAEADTSGAEPQETDTTAAAAGDETSTQAELRPLTGLLLDQGVAGQFLVAEQDVPTVERYLALEGVRNAIPRSVTLHWGTEVMSLGGTAYRPLYALEENPILTGEFLEDAGPAQRDPTFNQPIVPFQTTRRGARIFERGTAPNVGNNMAIVLDNRVQSYAVLRSTLSRRAQIELAPGSPLQEAQDLALVLRAGALPQPIQIVAEYTVGPSLGADSIRQGTRAFLIGIIAVVIVMIAYYRMSGVMAIGALAVYVLLVMGGLAGLGATLTLPGIAGLILSVGMGVDANVLIFERIREEVGAEKTPRTAVEAGFANALSAIVDANLTTLITGIILFQFGTGPIRGFAVTLCIGILASFFSAVFVTRTLFMIYLDRRSPSAPVSI